MLKTAIYQTKQKVRIVKFNVTKETYKLIFDKTITLEDGSRNKSQLKEIAQKEALHKTNIISCLFRHQVGVRFFCFPSANQQEIAQMVGYESAELLPLKPEETTTRHLILNTRANGYSDTLVIVTHKEEVTKLVQGFENSGLVVDILNLSSLAILNCLLYLNKVNKQAIIKNNFMIVYFEDGAIEIIIARAGIMAFSRGFLVGDAKNFSQVLISEIRHSIELFFNNTNDRKIEGIIIGGSNSKNKDINDVLKAGFDIPIEVNANIDIALGLVVSDRFGVNLLSDESIKKRVGKRLKNKFLFSAALIITNIFLIGAMFMVSLNNKRVYLKTLEKKLSQIKPEAQVVQDKARKLRMIKTQLSSQLLILDAITDLINVTSASSTLNMLSINEEGVLVVRGQTKNLQEVLDFVSAIENSPYFKNSHLNYSSRRKMKDQELIDFEIQALLDKEQNR